MLVFNELEVSTQPFSSLGVLNCTKRILLRPRVIGKMKQRSRVARPFAISI